MIDLSKLSDDEVSKLDVKDSIQKPKEKLTDWRKEPSLEDLKLDYQNAQSSHNEFITNIDRWEKLYDAPKIGNENQVVVLYLNLFVSRQSGVVLH